MACRNFIPRLRFISKMTPVLSAVTLMNPVVHAGVEVMPPPAPPSMMSPEAIMMPPPVPPALPPAPPPVSVAPKPFLNDIAAKINTVLLTAPHITADELVRIVREEVRVDQAVICINRDPTNDKFYMLNSRQQYNGVVTDPNVFKDFDSFFKLEALQKAIEEANATSPAGTFTRPTKIIPTLLQLSSNGMIQFFQVNISVIDRDNICIARFSAPEITDISQTNKIITPSSTPANSTSFREAVALKIEDKMSPGSTNTVQDVMQAVVREVEVEEAVICVIKTPTSYFRLHSRPGNDGFVSAAEKKDYDTFFKTVEMEIKKANPTPGLPFVRPTNIAPIKYTLLNKDGVQQYFLMYPTVIDAKHVCFGRVIAPTPPKTTPVPSAATTPIPAPAAPSIIAPAA